MDKKEFLSGCEEKVMAVIWSSEKELDLAGTRNMVNERFNKQWKPQTVSTFLARLVKKGYLTSKRIGRYTYYHPEITKEEYRLRKMIELVGTFYDGKKDDAVKDILGWQI